jgi:hypothetical protein
LIENQCADAISLETINNGRFGRLCMKPLLFLALMTCLTWTTNASAQDRHMYLGPRQPAVDVLTLTGFGTNNAVAQGRVTERSARAHCDNFYTPETATKMAQCIADHLQEHAKSYQISADCDGGRITSVFGDRFTFAGQRRRTSEGDTPNVSLWRDTKGQDVPHSSPYSPGNVVAQNWSVVCGSAHRPATQSTRAEIPVRVAQSEGGPSWSLGSRRAGFDGLPYTHNGSFMKVDERLGEIRYEQPRRGLQGTISPGDVVFRGRFVDAPGQRGKGRVSGVAYTFKKGCAPARYAVEGSYDPKTITMTGNAPRRAANSCEVLGASGTSTHATLVFTLNEGD